MPNPKNKHILQNDLWIPSLPCLTPLSSVRAGRSRNQFLLLSLLTGAPTRLFIKLSRASPAFSPLQRRFTASADPAYQSPSYCPSSSLSTRNWNRGVTLYCILAGHSGAVQAGWSPRGSDGGEKRSSAGLGRFCGQMNARSQFDVERTRVGRSASLVMGWRREDAEVRNSN